MNIILLRSVSSVIGSNCSNLLISRSLHINTVSCISTHSPMCLADRRKRNSLWYSFSAWVFWSSSIPRPVGFPVDGIEVVHVENTLVHKRPTSFFLLVLNRWKVIWPLIFDPTSLDQRRCLPSRKYVSSIIAVSSFRPRKAPGKQKWNLLAVEDVNWRSVIEVVKWSKLPFHRIWTIEIFFSTPKKTVSSGPRVHN